jgi:hypothetical protein
MGQIFDGPSIGRRVSNRAILPYSTTYCSSLFLFLSLLFLIFVVVMPAVMMMNLVLMLSKGEKREGILNFGT